MNRIGKVLNENISEELELHQEIHDNLKEYSSIDVEGIDPVGSIEEELVGPTLCIGITSEEELNFLRTLMRDEEKEEDYNELDIQVVIPIEEVLRPVGFMRINYDNLIKIKIYNPRIDLSIVTENSINKLTDEDIVCL